MDKIFSSPRVGSPHCNSWVRTREANIILLNQTRHYFRSMNYTFGGGGGGNEKFKLRSGIGTGDKCGCRVTLQTLKGCKLGIGRYPDFEYNAVGGGGDGMGEILSSSLGRVDVKFDIQSLFIPPLTYQTTKFLGLPLPPFLSITIIPQILQGFIHQDTGKVELCFRANFYFTLLSLYKPPPLQVETVLTTEEVKGEMRNGRGERRSSEGCCKLVGLATVVPITDSFLNSFLRLPTECLAHMSAKILLSPLNCP